MHQGACWGPPVPVVPSRKGRGVSGSGHGEPFLGALFSQILGKVYSVLSDREQRAVYDEQGTVDEDSDMLTQDRDWETYWRLLFKKVEKLEFSL